LGTTHQHNNDILLVLCGNNNLGKTYFWNELFSVFSEKQTLRTDVPKEDDLTRFAAGNYLCIFDDIASDFFKKSDAIKSILTNNKKGLVAKYSNYASNHKLISSFVATSNFTDIIFDSEFNRRVIPINISGRNKDAFDKIDKIDFFAEAYNLYLAGFDYKLNESEIDFVKNELNQKNKHTEFGADLLLEYVIPSKPHEGGLYYQASELITYLPDKLCKSVQELCKMLIEAGFVKKGGARRDGKQLAQSYCAKVIKIYYDDEQQ
jgi:predicted P-loop ATPase